MSTNSENLFCHHRFPSKTTSHGFLPPPSPFCEDGSFHHSNHSNPNNYYKEEDGFLFSKVKEDKRYGHEFYIFRYSVLSACCQRGIAYRLEFSFSKEKSRLQLNMFLSPLGSDILLAEWRQDWLGWVWTYRHATEMSKLKEAWMLYQDKKNGNRPTHGMDGVGEREGNNHKGANMSDLLACPITHEWMTEPVVVSDGYTYEKSAILRWMMENPHSRSPMTNEYLDPDILLPNRCLSDVMERMVHQKKKEKNKK